MAAPLGNQNARKARRWQDALNKALARFESKDGLIKQGEALDAIALVVVGKAVEGDKDSIAEIGNRLDGKVVQPVSGDDEADPIRTVSEIVIRAVDAARDRPT